MIDSRVCALITEAVTYDFKTVLKFPCCTIWESVFSKIHLSGRKCSLLVLSSVINYYH